MAKSNINSQRQIKTKISKNGQETRTDTGKSEKTEGR